MYSTCTVGELLIIETFILVQSYEESQHVKVDLSKVKVGYGL